MLKLSKDGLIVIASSMSSNHHWLETGCDRYFEVFLNYWNIKQKNQNGDIRNIKTYIPIKFKDKTWNDNEIINKRKLKYYEKFLNLSLVQKYFLTF